MARQDLTPEDRDQPLRLESLVDCVFCGVTFDVLFIAPDGVFDLEDLDEAPTADVCCPSCNEKQIAEYTGWTIHNEA